MACLQVAAKETASSYAALTVNTLNKQLWTVEKW
jgi:hypothetical protein